jgi:TRAP transporter TAXI family solute receptor
MAAKYGPFYFAAPIPKETYLGMDKDISAVAGMVLFVAHKELPEPLAYDITKALLEHVQDLVAINQTAREVSLTNAIRGSSIPFHPGALRYYREKGIVPPEVQ